MDVELIRTIEATVYEIWRLKQKVKEAIAAGQTPPEYLRKKIRHLDKQLNQMRSVAVYYKEYSSIENLQLLGENYIKQMKRDLTPLTFQTSILCKQIGIAKDGFYSSMRESHKYDASNFEYLDTLWQSNVVGLSGDVPATVFTSQADRDVNPDAPSRRASVRRTLACNWAPVRPTLRKPIECAQILLRQVREKASRAGR